MAALVALAVCLLVLHDWTIRLRSASPPERQGESWLLPHDDFLLRLLPHRMASVVRPLPAPYPVIDVHVHPWPTGDRFECLDLDALMDEMDGGGVEKIVLGVNARPPEVQPPIFSRREDEKVLEAYRRYPDRIIPALGGFDPEDPAAPAYVEAELKKGVWAAIAELDLWNEWKRTFYAPGDPVLTKIYRLAARHGVPVLLHYSSSGDPSTARGLDSALERVLRAHPETTFVMCHDCPDELLVLPNVWREFTLGTTAFPAELADRLVLGSDLQNPEGYANSGKHGAGAPYCEVVGELRAAMACLPEAKRRLVARENALRLFGGRGARRSGR
ncbi:MAG: amidohydrolase family protein [Candidatus Riflebacteria bacterium]|nr:amidohydrolase family protein [Candidatus Riflebacteria bacterium]